MVFDITDIHAVNIDYCESPNDDRVDRKSQLLRHSWFPATFTRPNTIFTFDLLDTFHENTLQGKGNIYDFYEDCTLPHLLCRKLLDSSRFHWNLPESNPGMSWCDKGQTGIFILGGVRQSPLETSIIRRSPRTFFSAEEVHWTLAESSGITRLQRNPME